MKNAKIKQLKDRWLCQFDDMEPFSDPDTSESVELMIESMPVNVREEAIRVQPAVFAAIALYARQALYRH